MNDFLFVYMILIHYLADFGLQTSQQAENKSSDDLFLFYHVGVYSLTWLLALSPLLGFGNALVFSLLTFLCHYWTDYFTSRIGKPFWAKKDFGNGFKTVGFDQMLHYIQLYYTLKLFI